MNQIGIPTVQITLDHMKHSIRAALSEHMVRQDADIKAAVESAVDNFDIQSYIAEYTVKEIERELKNTVDSIVRDALYRCREELSEVLRGMVLKTLVKISEQEQMK